MEKSNTFLPIFIVKLYFRGITVYLFNRTLALTLLSFRIKSFSPFRSSENRKWSLFVNLIYFIIIFLFYWRAFKRLIFDYIRKFEINQYNFLI